MSDKKITVTVHEYGNMVMTSTTGMTGQLPDGIMEAATSLIDRYTQEIREVLDICGDAEIIDNFHIVEGPVVDVLGRFKPLGFYGRFASANYDKLQAHFTCRKPHEPDEITLEYIQQIILRYAEQQRQYDEEDDDY